MIQVLSSKQSELLDNLTTLANGDAELVDKAIRSVRQADGASSLEDIMEYIELARSKT